ncbi:MAG: hypothetical protein ACLR6S_10925 [Lacrimispora saccharolytica]
MTDREFAEWLVEMVELCKQLPEEYLQDWKNDVKETIAPEKWDNAEKWINIIWKFRSLNDEEFLRLKKALEEAGTSTKAK